MPPYPPAYGAPYGYAAPPAGPAPGLLFAGFWRRFGGYLIDGLLITIVTIAVLWPPVIGPYAQAVGAQVRSQVEIQQQGGTVITQTIPITSVVPLSTIAMSLILVAVLTAAYWTLTVWLWGASVGQKAVGVKVVQTQTLGRLDGARAFLRSLIFWVPSLLQIALPGIGLIAGLIAFIGLLAVSWDSRRQGWHDKLAGSFVVYPLPTPYGYGAYPAPGYPQQGPPPAQPPLPPA